MSTIPKRILPLIVLSQFAGTSLWFAGNAILPDIQASFGLGKNAIANITSAVQFGFITGTLIFALLSIVDRFSPTRIFFVSSFIASFANLGVIWIPPDGALLMLIRFLTGFFIAGIYPVGMKIASDWYEKGLGKALGYLLGALVLGTAFPHLLRSFSVQWHWQTIIHLTSLFAMLGGFLMLLLVKDGPHRKKSDSFHPRNLIQIFQSKPFRSAAIGYFGHMWELYTFWAFIPPLILMNRTAGIPVSLFTFLIIASGALSCVAGGYLSQKKGNAFVAFYALLVSGICCLLSFLIPSLPQALFILFMLIWGMSVVADSPQFSTLVAATAPPSYKGTALTLVISIGFSITILSVQLLNYALANISGSAAIFMLLAPGPLIGLCFLYRSFIKGGNDPGVY